MCEYTVTIKVNSCANCPHSRYAHSTSPLLGKSGLYCNLTNNFAIDGLIMDGKIIKDYPYVINKQNTYTNISHLKRRNI